MEPPDAGAQRFRFGCGFVFGFVITIMGSVGFAVLNRYYLIAIALLIGLSFGICAMKYGDSFWDEVVRWWW